MYQRNDGSKEIDDSAEKVSAVGDTALRIPMIEAARANDLISGSRLSYFPTFKTIGSREETVLVTHVHADFHSLWEGCGTTYVQQRP